MGDRSYDILIGRRLIDTLGETLRAAVAGNQTLIVCDEAVASPAGKLIFRKLADAGFDCAIHQVPSGEASKNADEVARIWGVLADGNFDRGSSVVALGGGMVGDLAGFAAASYLRGVSFVQVPTTLLAMVDSSVGGKTGINLPQGKNLVGAFHQPRLVVADLDLLQTLPAEERASGLAEVIKYGVIYDAEFFAFLEGHIEVLFDPADVSHLVHTIQRSVEIKADVVSQDERESGLRAILNFGHTLGHAVEAEADYGGLRHGECVAIGMVAASLLTVRRGIEGWTEREHERLVALIEKANLPTRIPATLGEEQLLRRTRIDKKTRNGKVNYVLPTRLGHVDIVRDVTDDEVRAVIRDCRETAGAAS